MAIIGKIRKHSGLAVIFVGVAIAAFVMSDLFRAGPANYKDVGIIEGNEIPYSDFNYKVEDNIEAQKINQQKESLTHGEAFTIRQNTWNQIVKEIILDKEFEKLGLTVTSDELFELIQGEYPHELILQYFVNPETNQYDRNMVLRYLQNLNQLTPEQRRQWINFEKYIKRDRLNTKYNTLVSKGFYAPEAFAKMLYENQKKNAELLIGYKKYVDVADSLVSSTDEDFREYYDNNSYRFKQTSSRDIDYLVFEVEPTQDDFDKTEQDVKRIFEEFLYTENIPYFVNAVSDTKYDSVWWDEGTLPIALDTVFYNATAGAVIKPYFEDNTWHMAKLVDIQYRPDSMKAEHILISFVGAIRAAQDVTRTKEQAKDFADSLYQVISRNPVKLSQLAKDLSNDGSAAQNNGLLDWFPDGNMVHAFNQAVLEGKTGEVTLAETPFGYHIIRILDKLPPTKKIRVAEINRGVEVSDDTFQKYYIEASQFAGENNNIAKFDQAIIDQGLDKRTATHLMEMSNSIPGLEYARPVIRWVFNQNAEVGSVSPVFDLDGKYLVAVITVEREEGQTPYEEMKDMLINNIKNELKAQLILDQIKNKNATTFYEIIAAAGMKVDTNNILTFSSRNIPGFGGENDVIGSVFAMNEKDFLGPIKGNGGVFVVQINRFGEVPALGSYLLYKNNLIDDITRRINNNYHYKAIEKNSDIEDNRVLFY